MTKHIAIVGILFVVVLANVGPAFAGPGPLKLAVTPADLRAALPPAAATEQAAAPKAKRFNHPVRSGALLGLVAGITVGAIGMKSSVDDCPAGRSCSTAGAGVLFGAVIGTALGAGVGAIAGWIANK